VHCTFGYSQTEANTSALRIPGFVNPKKWFKDLMHDVFSYTRAIVTDCDTRVIGNFVQSYIDQRLFRRIPDRFA
jgi:hypothetical protein